jgi:hypothetical protein
MLSKGARTAQHDETRWVKHSRRSCMKQARKEKRDAERAVQAGLVKCVLINRLFIMFGSTSTPHVRF